MVKLPHNLLLLSTWASLTATPQMCMGSSQAFQIHGSSFSDTVISVITNGLGYKLPGTWLQNACFYFSQSHFTTINHYSITKTSTLSCTSKLDISRPTPIDASFIPNFNGKARLNKKKISNFPHHPQASLAF